MTLNTAGLREALDRADAMATAQARTIQAQQETIDQYRKIVTLQHREIARLERLAGVVSEAS